MREGRPQGGFLVFERGVHMVSTAPDADTTRRLGLARVEAPPVSLFEPTNWPAPRCANRATRPRPHRLNRGLTGAEKYS